MDDVIENCQTTFEEDGVNQHTLDDLRKVGLFLFSWLLWSVLLQQIITIVAGSILRIFSALRIVQSKRFGFFVDASVQRLVWRNVRFLGVGEILSEFWGDAEHLTHFYAAPRYFSIFPFIFLPSQLCRDLNVSIRNFNRSCTNWLLYDLSPSIFKKVKRSVH